MIVNTPNNTTCTDCVELESTECVVEEQSVPSLGLPAGSRLNTIIKYLDQKLKYLITKLDKITYKEVTINIPAAEVRALHTTGKILLPYNATLGYNVENIVLITKTNGTIEYTYVGASSNTAYLAVIRQPLLGDINILTSPANETDIASYTAGATIVAARMRTDLTNPGLSIYDGSVVLKIDGEMTLGNSDLTVIVTYKEIKL